MKKVLFFLLLTCALASCSKIEGPAPIDKVIAAMSGPPWIMTAYAIDLNNNGIIDSNELKRTNDTFSYSLFLFADTTGTEVFHAGFYKNYTLDSMTLPISLVFDTTVVIKKWLIKLENNDTNFYATSSSGRTVMSHLINMSFTFDTVQQSLDAHAMTLVDTTQPKRWTFFTKYL